MAYLPGKSDAPGFSRTWRKIAASFLVVFGGSVAEAPDRRQDRRFEFAENHDVAAKLQA